MYTTTHTRHVNDLVMSHNEDSILHEPQNHKVVRMTNVFLDVLQHNTHQAQLRQHRL